VVGGPPTATHTPDVRIPHPPDARRVALIVQPRSAGIRVKEFVPPVRKFFADPDAAIWIHPLDSGLFAC